MSVSDVQASLFDVLCKSNTPVGEDANAGESAKPDENSKYKAEFKAEAAYAKTMTVDEYVAMRRVDDGLDLLVPGT
jgi:hypothetical protein